VKNESYYHSVILSWFLAYGFDVKIVDSTSEGKIDATLETKDSVVITEFKYSHDKKNDKGGVIKAKSVDELIDDVFVQIHDKKYFKKYYNKNKIILLGVGISNKDIGVKFELLE
jgi:uncharacterized protein with PIN domain